MIDSVVVREYAELTTAPVENSLHRASVSHSCFNWLLEQHYSLSEKGKSPFTITGQQTIKLNSNVGFIQSPCGTSIEIIPKIFRETPSEIEQRDSRRVLLKMIAISLKLPFKKLGTASLNLLKYPLPEWIYTQFLQELDVLYKKGIRFQYQQVEEQSRFLRGQLNTSQQLRQPPGREHFFQIRHEVFSPNRAENRLIRRALDIARTHVKESNNWRLANELSHLLSTIPPSRNVDSDFKVWKDNRLMVSYRGIRPWCELIIRQLNPASQKGDRQGISLLFPMERLFENFVAHCLKQSLVQPWQLRTQVASQYLCRHQPLDLESPKAIFQLKPDLILAHGMKQQVLDTKWKRVDSYSVKNKYGLSQSDFYQLYAYGQKYMDGCGDMMLIYPAMDTFQEPLPLFSFDESLRLWIVPFDLKKEALISGAWISHFPAFSSEYLPIAM